MTLKAEDTSYRDKSSKTLLESWALMIQSQTNGTQQPNTTPESSDLLLHAPAGHSLAKGSTPTCLCPHWSCCCPRTHATVSFLSQALAWCPLPARLPPRFHSCLRRPKQTHLSSIQSFLWRRTKLRIWTSQLHARPPLDRPQFVPCQVMNM